MVKNLFLVAFLSLVGMVASCSKSDSPADSDIFVGTYKGAVTFVKEGTDVNKENVSITVAKVGSDYVFRFSDGIDNLTGVKFKKEGDTLFNVDFEKGIQYIKVTASSLSMLYMQDGKTWTVLNATR